MNWRVVAVVLQSVATEQKRTQGLSPVQLNAVSFHVDRTIPPCHRVRPAHVAALPWHPAQAFPLQRCTAAPYALPARMPARRCTAGTTSSRDVTRSVSYSWLARRCKGGSERAGGGVVT